MPLVILPNSGQTLAQTRDDIKNNFSNIDTGFAVNHVGYNSGGDSGKHTKVVLVNQAAVPATGGAESCIYGKGSLVAPNAPAIFIKGQNSLITDPGIEITYALKATKGWTQFPSGIIEQWGLEQTVKAAGSTGTTITFARLFPTAVLSIQLTAVGNGSNTILMVLKSSTVNDFTVYSRTGNDSDYTTSNFYIYATGY